ncbi:DNA polymerase III subunit gamma/tau [Glaciecola petra]|uniref:DNA polymerase III subunit gamma/tau n=1 Tax=Glaciecola petra TaxID=3075602 RepID=A0ABU2ZQ98_9ALTE|nr:DNA polymerase III subunit gamma/tau [Aestuariibacter sp. P117]MDT0594775.1 DNA polymerase III subunit gamma/tau [Aestuariibacter sp. P117]
MSYQVLARKWRPQIFPELVGQQHVVDAISNALQNDKLHHAYLFTGTRGVGKTTIARIFSKSLNCEEGQSANPCGKCNTCIDIADGRYVDLLEIDAASRTKVEDTRELLDNVQYRPTRGKYKVYLIDEVHMLSKHSFNALLKTLEEPPEHVKFLLATTDPQKLPVTILSRCLQFSLRALSKEQIQAHLAHILKHENIPFEDNALAQIAKAAQGSIRDSLSLTDQAIAQGNNRVSHAIVANMLGLLDKNQILKLVKYICEKDSQKALAQLDSLCDQSSDFTQVLSQIVGLLHQIALSQIVPEICKLESDSAKGIHVLSKNLSAQHVQMLYQIALNGKKDLPHAPDGRMGLQMTILRMLAFSPAQKIDLDVDALKSDASMNVVNDTIQQSLSAESLQKENNTLSSDSAIETTLVEQIDNPNSAGSDTNLAVTASDAHNQDEYHNDNRIDEHVEYANDIPVDIAADMSTSNVTMSPEAPEAETLMPHEDDEVFASKPIQGTDPEETPDNTLAVLQQSKQLDDLFGEDLSGDSGGKKPKATQDIASLPAVSNQYSLGHQFTVFDTTQHSNTLHAVLANGDKLINAAQVDEWSAFVDSTNIQAFTRQLLLHANCSELSNPLKLKIDANNKHLADDSVLASIKEKLSKLFGQNFEVEIDLNKVKNTPFEIQTRIDEIRLKYAREIVETDEGIQELKKAFDAEIIENSIVAR